MRHLGLLSHLRPTRRALRTVLAALASAGTAAHAQGPAPPPVLPPPVASEPQRCDGADAAKALGLARRDWHVGCLGLEGGRRVIAAVPMTPLGPPDTGKTRAKTPTAPPLVLLMALAQGEQIAWRQKIGFTTDAPEELREVLAKSEEWVVAVDGQTLRSGRGVRVGILGHWGAATMSVREIAMLFKVPGAAEKGPLQLVWQGLGNTRESRHDFCLIEGIASFQMVDDHTVEREVQRTPKINREAPVSRKLARALEKKCVAKSEPPQRFPIVQ